MAPDDVAQAARAPALSWSLVIPVKVLVQAKSRLAGLAAQRRSQLALAMAEDTIAAAVSARNVASVVVVTDDPDVSKAALRLGAQVLPDEPAAGLNDALSYGADFSTTTWPERGRAGLAADLPAAQPGELAAALAAAAVAGGTAFVPDADGTGTVLYAAVPGAEFRPRFGPSSRDRHRAAGATEIGAAQAGAAAAGAGGVRMTENGAAAAGTAAAGGGEARATETGAADIDAVAAGAGGAGAAATGAGIGETTVQLSGLRRDVDTIGNLRAAVALGLGPRTRALLAADSSILG